MLPFPRLSLTEGVGVRVQLKIFFPDVTIAKPKSSRNSSIEAFVLCRHYAPPPGFRPEALQSLLDQASCAEVTHPGL